MGFFCPATVSLFFVRPTCFTAYVASTPEVGRVGPPRRTPPPQSPASWRWPGPYEPGVRAARAVGVSRFGSLDLLGMPRRPRRSNLTILSDGVGLIQICA